VIFLCYSDLHIRPERLEDCEKALVRIGEVALKLQDKLKSKLMIVNGGDTFNTRGLIRTICFDRLYHHYSKWFEAGLKQSIIVGNHDQEDRDGEIHPMRVFSNWDGWFVFDKPTTVSFDGVYTSFFPYLPKDQIPDAIKLAVSAAGEDPKHDAFVHWGIKGAMRNDFNKDTDGVPVEWLTPFRKVFSGHYHFRNAFENVQYIGSPIQQNFSEMGQDKGIVLYDNKRGKKVEFVEIKGTAKHREVRVAWEDDKSVIEGDEEIAENDFLRIKASGDSERCATITQDWASKKFKCHDIKIEREVKDKAFSRLSLESTDVLNPDQIISKYVDFIDSSLDKKKLLEIGKSILEGHS
jgi:DNA repair exonuclease SbcCD nuclease subunit